MIRSLCFAVALMPALAFAQATTIQQSPDSETPAPETQTPEPQATPQAEAPMTMARLGEIIQALDPEVQQRGSALEFTLDGLPMIVVADPRADRMRAMVPIASAEGLSEEDLMRMMQANFDSALDARYAVANGRLWGVFIHPLSPLEQDQLLSGLVQTITLARTYGTAYSGGGAVYGGGDSNEIFNKLLEELRKKGQEL